MKRIVLLVMLSVLPIFAFAQEDRFSIDGESLIWRKVYIVDEEVTARALAYNMHMAGVFHEFFFDDGLITCELEGLKPQFKDLGYKRMSLPIYLSSGTISAFVSVEYKSDRFRVTVARMIVKNDKLGNSDLEDFAVKEDGGFKKEFFDPAGKIIAHTFDAIFSNLATGIDDEW